MKPFQFRSISALLQLLELPSPIHPLVSIVDRVSLNGAGNKLPERYYFDFYIISYKTDHAGKLKYGQRYYDFDRGSMIFIAPGQVMANEQDLQHAGYSILIHPDYLSKHPLGAGIKKFGFFSYSAHEALHLSASEQTKVVQIFQNMEDELKGGADDFTHILLLSHFELLLNYCSRFYKRQFSSQKIVKSDLLENLERILNAYFDSDAGLQNGLPSVKHLAKQLHYSSRYLSDMLRSLTGVSAQQHIQDKVAEKAKVMLSTGNASVAEIAYQLGFERPQSFNKFFKKKTDLSPLEFRKSFQ